MEEGSYLYCIIGTGQARNFGPVGIGGCNDEVSTISYGDVSCVISRSPLKEYALSRENLLCHQRVIETVMKDYTVLPVRFSTISASPEDIRGLLRKRLPEFSGLLKQMDGKVELGLKAIWKEMGLIYGEVQEDPEIKRVKEDLEGRRGGTLYEKIGLGRAVEEALGRKRDDEADSIVSAFKGLYSDMKRNKTHGESMLLNAAFLVDTASTGGFDAIVRDLDRQIGKRVLLKYVGPVPIFNFVNIVVEWN